MKSDSSNNKEFRKTLALPELRCVASLPQGPVPFRKSLEFSFSQREHTDLQIEVKPYVRHTGADSI
jgi:hypothetical protein